MKSYERFLGTIGGFFKVLITIALVGGLLGGVGYGIFKATAEDDAIRDTNRLAREWCLDNGGRTVKIDDVTGCFELSEVEIKVGFWNSYQSACMKNPNLVWIKSQNRGSSQRYCYSYKRIKKEQ